MIVTSGIDQERKMSSVHNASLVFRKKIHFIASNKKKYSKRKSICWSIYINRWKSIAKDHDFYKTAVTLITSKSYYTIHILRKESIVHHTKILTVSPEKINNSKPHFFLHDRIISKCILFTSWGIFNLVYLHCWMTYKVNHIWTMELFFHII